VARQNLFETRYMFLRLLQMFFESLPKTFMCDPAAEGPRAKSESELFVVRGTCFDSLSHTIGLGDDRLISQNPITGDDCLGRRNVSAHRRLFDNEWDALLVSLGRSHRLNCD